MKFGIFYEHDYCPNPNVALVSAFMLGETDEEARERAERWSFFQFALAFYAKQGPVEPGSVDLWGEYQKWKQTPKGQRSRGTGLIGSVETVRERLRRFEASNVDQVILLNQAGKNTHDHICESLEIFARQIMPEFHGREPEHQKWKRRVLDREIALEEIDTAPFTPAQSAARPTLPPSSQRAGEPSAPGR